MKNTRRAVSVIVAALVVALLATGCARTPGAAAIVGGERISVDEVQGAFEIFSAVNGTDPANAGQPGMPQGQVSQQEMVFYLMIGPLANKVAKESGGSVVSEDDAAKALSEKLTSLGFDPQTLRGREGAIDVLRYSESYGSIVSLATQGNVAPLNQVVDEFIKLDPEVNPRYGEFDWSPMKETAFPMARASLDLPWLASQVVSIP